MSKVIASNVKVMLLPIRVSVVIFSHSLNKLNGGWMPLFSFASPTHCINSFLTIRAKAYCFLVKNHHIISV